MGLKSKLSASIEVKANKDIFHDVFRHKPQHLSTMVPNHFQGFEYTEGDFGTVGSKVCVNYTLDGKAKVSKCTIDAIDEEKKLIKWKEYEGDLVNEYDNWSTTLHIDFLGDKDLVSWTMEYERPNEDVPELTNMLQWFIEMTKGIDDHHVKNN